MPHVTCYLSDCPAGAFNRIDPAGPAAQNLINEAFPTYNFDTLEGVSYQIDVSQTARYAHDGTLVAPQARPIVNLQFKGQPLDEAMRFVVVTNNYRASGGGNFPGLDGKNIIMDAPDENREALVQCLRATGTLDPAADNNWRILPVAGMQLRFSSGSGALPHLPRYPQIKLIKDNGDGSALFELAP